MLHVLQSLKDGRTLLEDVPVPQPTAVGIVAETRASVISPGTERMLVDFGRAGWIDKARSQPDRVRHVIDKIRTDGLLATVDAVRSKLETPISLGYNHAGVVVARGREVTNFFVGDRVVTNGPHAEYVSVPHTIAARIPDGVSFEQAAFTPLAAIGLQGLRLVQPTLGETAVVYGLGLIGLLTVQLARAAGCRVIGIDRIATRCELARRLGATTVRAEGDVDVPDAVMQATNGVGADAVLLTLATDSDEPLHNAAVMSRKRGRIVLVGVSGTQLRREDFYKKELSFQVSCGYGPGRYDAAYEDNGRDYPLPFVRWTEARNFEAVLALMADGRLDPSPLVTHRYPITRAPQAYDTVLDEPSALGVLLTYETKPAITNDEIRSRRERPSAVPARAVVGWIGAGDFSVRILAPAFAAAGATLAKVASRSGVSAGLLARRAGFRRATANADEITTDAEIDTVVVATRHDSHALWAQRALDAGKHVFVEKPLALTLADVDAIGAAAERAGKILCVGFNRRFAPDAISLAAALSQRSGPAVLGMTVNAGRIPVDHWTNDPVVGGGRLLGEACHFIDLARFLVRAPITSVQVTSARSKGGRVLDDTCVVQMAFADGSLATIQYLSNGSKRFPKERVEVFFDSKVVRLDNLRRVESWGASGVRGRWSRRQDKGHSALARAFVQSVQRGAESPIPLDELLEVSRVSIHAAQLARDGNGALRIGSGGVPEDQI